MDAEHLILVGTSGTVSSEVEVVALCLQTSGVTADPHEIVVRITDAFRDPSIVEAKCSCTAGLSQKCKHISAVLIHCYRSGLGSLPPLSCTDVACAWGTKKKLVQNMYAPAPIRTYCHVKLPVPPPQVPVTDATHMLQILQNSAPSSAIAVFKKRRRGQNSSTTESRTKNAKQACRSAPLPMLEMMRVQATQLKQKAPVEVMLHVCELYGGERARSEIESLTRGQSNSPEWHRYRKGLVTASIAHACMTRAKTFLRSKGAANIDPFLMLILRSRTITTPAMHVGITKESAARAAYKTWQEALGHTLEVRQRGLVLFEEFPFIGCSPDGVASFSCKCCEGKEVLLEIKCPTKLDNSFKNYDTLEPKLEYLTQVNVQMAVCHVKEAHFFVYCSDISFCCAVVNYNSGAFDDFKDSIISIYKERVISELLLRLSH